MPVVGVKPPAMANSLRLSRYVVASDSLHDRAVGFARRVVFSTRTARAIVLSESVWRALTDERLPELPTSIVESLVIEKVLVASGEDEVLAVTTENQEAIQSSEQLYHVIQPTAACQLGCGYCGQEHTAQLLSSSEQERLLERLRERLVLGKYSALATGWFGAEPLLGLSVIRELSPRLRSLATEHQVSYSAKIVTNGVLLTSAVALELSEQYCVRAAEVTLDGPPTAHDSRRATKGGRPTFGTILANLCAIRDRPEVEMRLVVRCNVDRQNVRHVSELIDLLAEASLQDRISFYVSPVHSWGNDADRAALSLDEFGEWEVEWLAQLHNRGFQTGLLPSRRKITCLAVRKDGELTDAFGDVFNCTEVSYVPSYGKPNLYTIGGSNIGMQALVPFRQFNQELLGGQHPTCHSCSMFPVCGGACPKLWSEGKVPCPSMKSNIHERLALWYALRKEASLGHPTTTTGVGASQGMDSSNNC